MNLDGLADALNKTESEWNTTYLPATQYVCTRFDWWSTNMTTIYTSANSLKVQVDAICTVSVLNDNCAQLTIELNALVQACANANNSVSNVCLFC